jgi:hypothetical protein
VTFFTLNLLSTKANQLLGVSGQNVGSCRDATAPVLAAAAEGTAEAVPSVLIVVGHHFGVSNMYFNQNYTKTITIIIPRIFHSIPLPNLWRLQYFTLLYFTNKQSGA